VKLYNTWTKPLEIPVLASRKSPGADSKGTMSRQEKIVNESAYNIIVQKDLFRPSRTPVKKDTSSPPVITSKEKPQLFGTTIMGELKSAILEDPTSKTTKLYHVNDSIGGFTISEIFENKVVLEKGGAKVVIKLREKKDFKPPKPVVTKKQTPRRTPRRTTPRRRTPTQRRPAPETANGSAR
jgi:hypothetical protein